MEIMEQIAELVRPILEKNQYQLDQVLYEKEGNVYFLRVIIDKEGYITIEDCVTVSNLIGSVIEESDLIKESYILDVCSKEKGGE